MSAHGAALLRRGPRGRSVPPPGETPGQSNAAQAPRRACGVGSISALSVSVRSTARRSGGWLALLLLGTWGAARAEDACWAAPRYGVAATRAVGMVDTVRVDGERPEGRTALARRSGFAAVIPLGAHAPLGRDLGDLLDRTLGVDVQRYGGLGAFATASVRGSSAAQVKVCLDGVPLSTGGHGFVNLALLPASSLAQVTVYRGPEASGFGGPAAAGVIDLSTPTAVASPARLALGIGSFDTRIARGQWGLSSGPLGLFASGETRRSDGDFPYLNRNGTLHQNRADDRVVRRRNNDWHDRSLLWKGAYTPAWGRLQYTGQDFARVGGIPGTENIQTESVRLETERASHHLGLMLPWTELTVAEERQHERLDNRAGEVGLGKVHSDQVDRTRTGRLELRAEGTARLRGVGQLIQSLQLAGERSDERLRAKDLATGSASPTRRRASNTAVAEYTAGIARLSLSASQRWIRTDDRFGAEGIGIGATPATNPTRRDLDGLTLGLRFDAGRGLSFKANRGRLHRLPTFAELFGENGVQQGNHSLVPEAGLQWDAGLAFAPRGAFQLEAVFFERVVEDEITWLQNSQRTVKAFNLDRAWVRGGELRLFGRSALPACCALEVQAHGTSQLGRDVGESRTYRGKRLPNLPLREAFVAARLNRGGSALLAESTIRSSAYRDRYNTEAKQTPGHHVVGLGAEQTIPGTAIALRFQADNVGNVRVMDVDGFPLPGRTYLLEVKWTL
ncbi:MAG: TonB-dependent receptor [Candidatus Eisenbacteria bacterium]|nr:TonB-dependent receptor [Candidatus Eisenbacteria bacterium]